MMCTLHESLTWALGCCRNDVCVMTELNTLWTACHPSRQFAFTFNWSRTISEPCKLNGAQGHIKRPHQQAASWSPTGPAGPRVELQLCKGASKACVCRSDVGINLWLQSVLCAGTGSLIDAAVCTEQKGTGRALIYPSHVQTENGCAANEAFADRFCIHLCSNRKSQWKKEWLVCKKIKIRLSTMVLLGEEKARRHFAQTVDLEMFQIPAVRLSLESSRHPTLSL